MRDIDNYFFHQKEAVRDCMLFLRSHVLQYDSNITEKLNYGMPFYYYNGKRFCYLWIHKKYGMPYLGIVDGANIERTELLSEKRAKMKILLIDPEKDIPIGLIDNILEEILAIYKDK